MKYHSLICLALALVVLHGLGAQEARADYPFPAIYADSSGSSIASVKRAARILFAENRTVTAGHSLTASQIALAVSALRSASQDARLYQRSQRAFADSDYIIKMGLTFGQYLALHGSPTRARQVWSAVVNVYGLREHKGIIVGAPELEQSTRYFERGQYRAAFVEFHDWREGMGFAPDVDVIHEPYLQSVEAAANAEWEKAASSLGSLIAQNQQFRDTHFTLGEVLHAQGDKCKAQAELLKASSLSYYASESPYEALQIEALKLLLFMPTFQHC